MTKANQYPVELSDDDMLPEYDFSQGVRGKHAHRVGKPYSVTIRNADGTATVQQFDGAGNMTSEKQNVWIGDRVAGDKVMGDKVMGDKVIGDKIVNTQNLAQAAQDIKSLLDQLTIDYPTEGDYVRAGRAIETIKNNPTLKQRLLNAAKESGTTAVEKAIEAVVDNPAVSIIVAGVKGFIEAEG
jgi:hypothetical protein